MDPNILSPPRENVTLHSGGPNTACKSVVVSTTCKHETEHYDLTPLPEHIATMAIWKYCPPVLLMVGTFGNVATLVVYTRVKWGSSTQPLLLTALATVDLCVLYSGLVPDIAYHVFGLDLRGLNDVACKVLTWLMESSAFMSSWLLVAMTMQRAMSITWPHRMVFICSKRKAGLTIVFVALTGGLSQSHMLYGLEVHKEEVFLDGACAPSGDYEMFSEKVWPWLDFITFCALPSILLLASNTALIRSLRTSVRHVCSMSNTGRADHRKEMTSSMTFTLITVSFTFLLLTTPIEAAVIAWWMLNEQTEEDPLLLARMELAWAIVNMLWYTNSAVNFWLYCISGSRFRRQFIGCFKCQTNHLSSSVSSVSLSVQRSVVSPLGV